MRLFLSDSFFDKLVELPKNIQQNVRTFQRKFRENSQSSAIHLEKIAQFKDASLRSARVDGEYRAILGALGSDNFMLLYVDKHDLAYDWAKNKKFQWNEYTQTCQIMQVEFVKEEVAEPTSTQVPGAFAALTDEQLLTIGVPVELLPLARSIKDLNDLDQSEKNFPQDAFENLFALMDGEDIANIIADIEEGKAKSGEDSLLSNNNKRRFVELTDDEYLSQILEEGMEKWQLFLHPSQSKLVSSNYRGTIKVSGSAGTGKTIAALHRLKHLCENPEAKVLFTTYTKALMENIADSVAKMKIPEQRYILSNIDKMLNEVATTYNVLPAGFHVQDYSGDDHSKAMWSEVLEHEVSEFDEDFLYAEYIDVIVYNNIKTVKDYLLQARIGRAKALSRKQRIEVWKLKEKYEALKQQRHAVDRLELFNMTANYMNEHDIHPFTNVIADEFQDFSNPELRFLRALVAEGENDLFLTGDPFQRIYSGRKISFSNVGINVRGKKSVKLKVNYRTTEEIKRIAVSVVKDQKYDDLDGGEENNKGYISLVHGERPSYKVVQGVHEETKLVLQYLTTCEENGIQPCDICIAARTRMLYKSVQDELHRLNIKYKELKSGTKVGASDGVSLCTFHSLKGLEFRAMILIGVNEKSMPSQATPTLPFASMDAAEKKDFLAGIRSLLYVAITRARQAVFVTGYGQPTGLLEVSEE
jgi:hypothetical protein